jgi:uncharacterized protein (DUF433 family)
VPHGDQLDRLIESDPAVMLGKPVIRGTRITVELILRKLGAGETMEQIIESLPRLTCEQIRAALAYAAEDLACSVALAEDWDRKLEAESSIDVFMKDMADTAGAGGEDFRNFDAVANHRWGNAECEEEGRAGDSVCHAEGAVDDLAGETD